MMNKLHKCELCDTSVSFPTDNIQGGAPVCPGCKEKYLMPRAKAMSEAAEALRELQHALACFEAKKEATLDTIRERKATEEIAASERFLHERQEQRAKERAQKEAEMLEAEKALAKIVKKYFLCGALVGALIVLAAIVLVKTTGGAL